MNMDLNNYENQYNYEFNTSQNNKINYPKNNIPVNNMNINNNLVLYDKRLVICLKYLGLNKYISNFTKRGLKFEDFLSLSNSDLTALKIPPNIQDIIQKFMISYFNYGSMYTIEEIVQFFKTRRVARYVPKNNENNINERNAQSRYNVKYKSVNDKRKNSLNNINNMQNINIDNNLQRNLNQNNRNINRPKSQKNKIINNTNYFNTNIQNNINRQFRTNNHNINPNQIQNFKTSNNNINNIKRKNNKNNMRDNITNSNSNISSLQSSQNNFNFYNPSLDNFSHMAMKENSPQILNMMKMAKFKNININNINQLKKNLVKNFQKSKNNNNTNINNRNKKLIKDNKRESNVLSRSTSKDIINRMDEVLKRYQSSKKSTNTSSNLNMNKGYHSDGYAKEKRNIQEQILKNNLNNINLEGYEINTYYAGDTSKFSSLYGNSNELKQMNKGGKINSKINKQKKINEDQARKIEYLLAHGGSSSLKSANNNYLIMNNFNINNDEELSLMSDNKSRTNLTNYTNLTSNNNNQRLFHKKNNYINQVNNNINSLKQKNLLIQRQNYKNKISKNKPNNFNTFASNRGNISSNYYQNNNNDENIKLINNMIQIPNTQTRLQKNDGPVQISNINKKRKNNNNINIPSNYNNIINERENYFNANNNSMSNYSMGQNIQYNNLKNYPMNKYMNNFIENRQQIQQKRSTKSYDKQTKNRIYAGIHNINNNINNININNINYDGKRISDGFNNFIDLDMKMNYHRTQHNFYNPNNLLNNNDDYNDIY